MGNVEHQEAEATKQYIKLARRGVQKTPKIFGQSINSIGDIPRDSSPSSVPVQTSSVLSPIPGPLALRRRFATISSSLARLLRV